MIRTETLRGTTTLEWSNLECPKNLGYVLAVPTLIAILAAGPGVAFFSNLEEGWTTETIVCLVLFVFLSLLTLAVALTPFGHERVEINEEGTTWQMRVFGLRLHNHNVTHDKLSCLEISPGNIVSGNVLSIYHGKRRMLPGSVLSDRLTRELYETLAPLLQEHKPDLEIAPHGQYTARLTDRSPKTRERQERLRKGRLNRRSKGNR